MGRQGRLWVQFHQPGYLADPADPADPGSADQWGNEPRPLVLDPAWHLFDQV